MRYLLLFLFCLAVARAAAPSYPKTRAERTVDTVHGTRVEDPYRWLEDQNSAETRAWIDAQMGLTRSLLDKRPGRERLAARLSELHRTETVSVPIVRGGRFFYTRRAPTQDLADIYMRSGPHGREELLIDANRMSADHTVSVSLMAVSADGSLLAYGIRKGGEDEVAVRILNVVTREHLPDELPKAYYFSVVYRPAGDGLFYSVNTDAGPRVRYHAFGTPADRDPTVFGEKLPAGRIVSLDDGIRSRHMLISVMDGWSAVDLYLHDFEPRGRAVVVTEGVRSIFAGEVVEDRIYIRSNHEAPNGRVMVAEVTRPQREHWREIVPERTMPLEDVVPAGDSILLHYLDAAASKLVLTSTSGEQSREIALPVKGTASLFRASGDHGQIAFQFSSFAVPKQIIRCDAKSGAQEIWHRQNVPLDSSKIEVRQVWYESKDKTRIPMFLVHKKGLAADGKRPVYLTGYGGFSVAETPDFDPRAVVWAEAGAVFALANLRGGSEFGEKWHEAGMLERKQNVFDDFVAAAEWLIREKYTNPSKLAIGGGSNGGLLVGAATVQRPELFQAVICGAPLLDMVRYHKFLVARFWVPEYGSSDDPEQFRYLLEYSPYHNVKSGVRYPAVLFMTGDADTRVAPLHARKMAARLQAATASERPILLHYDKRVGHAGGKPASLEIADWTDSLSFLRWQLGMKE